MRINDLSPTSHLKGLNEYTQAKNIGKIQPLLEMKLINENMIRQKLNRGKNEIANNNNLFPLTEVTSPTNFHSVIY